MAVRDWEIRVTAQYLQGLRLVMDWQRLLALQQHGPLATGDAQVSSTLDSRGARKGGTARLGAQMMGCQVHVSVGQSEVEVGGVLPVPGGL